MIIVAGGDSFIWGSELSDHKHGGFNGYSRLTFPALLSAGNEYKCCAYPGSSNTDICNNMILGLISFPKKIEELFVIVCWTWPTRDSGSESRDMVYRLQRALKDANIPYLFTCADNCLLEWLDDQTDWSHWFLFPPGEEWETPSPRGFYQWAVENKYPVGPEGHPLDEAHQVASELIKDKFNEMVKKHLEQNGSGNSLS